MTVKRRNDAATALHVPVCRLDEITTLVSEAAAAIMTIERGAVTARIKADLSPVTDADDAAHAIIAEGLQRKFPGIPVVSEEAGGVPPGIDRRSTFFLVDPLDGTREYLAGRDEFTVNVAIVSEGRPVLGCIAAPAHGLVWRGVAGCGAERLTLAPGENAARCRHKTGIHVRDARDSDLSIAISRSHLDPETAQFLVRFPQARRLACGSSLKFCRVAEGSVDVYPRLAPTHEWDVAAGHAIVAAAGGTVVAPNGDPLIYGRSAEGFSIAAFIAVGDRAATGRFVRAAHADRLIGSLHE